MDFFLQLRNHWGVSEQRTDSKTPRFGKVAVIIDTADRWRSHKNARKTYICWYVPESGMHSRYLVTLKPQASVPPEWPSSRVMSSSKTWIIFCWSCVMFLWASINDALLSMGWSLLVPWTLVHIGPNVTWALSKLSQSFLLLPPTFYSFQLGVHGQGRT